VHSDEEVSAYFQASRGLESDDPSIRLPAISRLIGLTRLAIEPIRARAAAALTHEFGPFAVTDGLSGCVAPISEVHECDAAGWDCRACAWLRNPPDAAAGGDSMPGRDKG
jgi:hypothetical protein